MTTKTSRRSKKRTVRALHMSKRARATTIENIYETSRRNLETVTAAWEYLVLSESRPGALGVVAAVLNRQIAELGFVTCQSKLLAESVGLQVQS